VGSFALQSGEEVKEEVLQIQGLDFWIAVDVDSEF